MKRTILMLSVLVCLMSCEKEVLENQGLTGEWTKSSIESPYSTLSFAATTVEIQRTSTEPMLCQYLQKDNIILAKENSSITYGRFGAIESLTDSELKIRFLNTEIERQLDSNQVFIYRRNF